MILTFEVLANTTVEIPILKEPNPGVTFQVNWDGINVTTHDTTNDDPYNPSHTFQSAGTYGVELIVTSGAVQEFGYLNWQGVRDLKSMTVINDSDWDLSYDLNSKLTKIEYLFSNATKLTTLASFPSPPNFPDSNSVAIPDNIPSTVTSVKGLFAFDYVADITTIRAAVPEKVFNWNMENVEDFSEMFQFTYIRPEYSSWRWNTRSALTMERMFLGTFFELFGITISVDAWLDMWNVGKCQNMSYMFNSSNFNGVLTKWDVREVLTMEGMFKDAVNFNDNFDPDYTTFHPKLDWRNALLLWEPTKCTNFKYMFQNATKYTGKIGNWQIAEGASMTDMGTDSGLNNSFNQFANLSNPVVGEFNQFLPEARSDAVDQTGTKLVDYDTTTGIRIGSFVDEIYKCVGFREYANTQTLTLANPMWAEYTLYENEMIDNTGTSYNSIYPTLQLNAMEFISNNSKNTESNPLDYIQPYTVVEDPRYMDTSDQEKYAKQMILTLFQMTDMFDNAQEQFIFRGGACIPIYLHNWNGSNNDVVPYITYLRITSVENGTYEIVTDKLNEGLILQKYVWAYRKDISLKLNPTDPESFPGSLWLSEQTVTSSTYTYEETTDLAYSPAHPLGYVFNVDNVRSIPKEFTTEGLDGNPVTITTGLASFNIPMMPKDGTFSILTAVRRTFTIDSLYEFYETHLPLPENQKSFAAGIPKITGQTIDTDAKFDLAREEIQYAWEFMQSSYGGQITNVELLKKVRLVYDETGFTNQYPSGKPTPKTISYVEFNENRLVTNHYQVSVDDLVDPACYAFMYFVPREALIQNNTDLKTKIDNWYTTLNSVGDNETGVNAANALEPGHSFFWITNEAEPITDISELFANRKSNNHPDVRYLSVKSVTNADNWFKNSTFNNPLAAWERILPDVGHGGSTTKNITSMIGTFNGATVFNQDVSSWDMSGVTNVTSMFEGALAFNNGGSNNIKDWDVKNCKNFTNMFYGANSFDRIIVNWLVQAYPQGASSKYVFPDGEAVNVGDDPDFGPNVRQMVYDSKLYNDETEPFGQGFYKIAEGVSDSNGPLDGTPRYSLFGQAICFNKGTQILCMKNNQELYVPVEALRKGDLVKTLNDGYKPIQTLTTGTFTLGRPMDMGMYKMKQEGSMIADLEMTGLHSILVNENDEEHADDVNRQITTQPNRKLYVKDHFRLHANYSSKFEKMPTSAYTIYSFSLEGQEAQYGIWANGVLVESTSNDYVLSGAMKEVLEHNENTKKE